jgi:hypothetical protein
MSRYTIEKHYVAPYTWEWDIRDAATGEKIAEGYRDMGAALRDVARFEQERAK